MNPKSSTSRLFLGFQRPQKTENTCHKTLFILCFSRPILPFISKTLKFRPPGAIIVITLRFTAKQNRSPSATRSASVGPKNPTFTSHVTTKLKYNLPPALIGSNSGKLKQYNLNKQVIFHAKSILGSICLPKDYKPEGVLENLEKREFFISKTFHTESGKRLQGFSDTKPKSEKPDNCLVQNAFTNFIYSENFDESCRVSILVS